MALPGQQGRGSQQAPELAGIGNVCGKGSTCMLRLGWGLHYAFIAPVVAPWMQIDFMAARLLQAEQAAAAPGAASAAGAPT